MFLDSLVGKEGYCVLNCVIRTSLTFHLACSLLGSDKGWPRAARGAGKKELSIAPCSGK